MAGLTLCLDDAIRFLRETGYMYFERDRISCNLECSVCSEPWDDPVQGHNCEHVFCRACLTEWVATESTCPLDRSPLPASSIRPAAKILRDLVDELTVVCSLGCGWTGRRDLWLKHLEETCPEVEVNGWRRGRPTSPEAVERNVPQFDCKAANTSWDWGDTLASTSSLRVPTPSRPSGSYSAPLSRSDACPPTTVPRTGHWTPPSQSVSTDPTAGGPPSPPPASLPLIGIRQATVQVLDANATQPMETLQSRRAKPRPWGRASTSLSQAVATWKAKATELEVRLRARRLHQARGSDPELSLGDEIHAASCDLCHRTITGTRWKCLKCPDYDLCSSCHPRNQTVHGGGHDFIPIYKPSDYTGEDEPRYWGVVHVGVRCDACGVNPLIGPRYKCATCPDYDMCYKCFARPNFPHDRAHPLILYHRSQA